MRCDNGMRLHLFFVIAAAARLAAGPLQAKDLLLFIGTYTNQGSKGIYVSRFDPAAGALSAPELAAETPNPTFLAVHPSGRFLYAANEVNAFQGARAGSITAYAIDAATGKLTMLNAVSTKGAGPCHVATDHKGKVCLAANYGGGSFASFRIEPDGRLSEAASFIQDEGSGPVKQRQAGPHSHSMTVSPGNGFAVGADLGTDKLLVFKIDTATGQLTANTPPFTATAPGAGPRHFAFRPNGKTAYAINELDSTVVAYAWDEKAGTLKELARVSTLPKDFKGQNFPAEIRVHPSGKFLYGSNRGQDSIALFHLDAKGVPTFVETVPSGGVMPRNFTLDPTGRWLLAANQRTGNIAVLSIDTKTGKLKDTGHRLEVSGAVCLKFPGR
jgi:6-phosphogluconolactonase